MNGIGRISVRSCESFYSDEMVQVRVIYHLQIIGEAVRDLSPEFRVKNPGIPWSDIAGMRNILLHHCFLESTGMRSRAICRR